MKSITASLKQAFGLFAFVLSMLSFLFFLLNIFSSELIQGFLITSIIFSLLFLLASNKVISTTSPVFLFGLIFLALMLFGIFSFNFFHGRSINHQVQMYVFVAFQSLFIGAYFGQFATLRLNKPRVLYYPRVCNLSLLKFLSILGFLSFILMAVIKGGFPLFSSNVDHARSEFYSGIGYLNIVYKMLPLVCGLIAVDGLQKGDRGQVLLAHKIFALLIISNILIAFRSLPAKNLITYFVMLQMAGAGRMSNIKIILATVVGIFFASILGSYRRGLFSFQDIMNELAITTSARPKAVELILERLETASSIQYSYWGDLKKLIPGPDTGQNVDLKFLIFDNAARMPESAGINPSIVGEALLVSGQSALILAPLLLGFFSGISYALARNRKSSIVWLLIYAAILPELLTCIATGIATRLPSIMIMIILAIILSGLLKYKFVFGKSVSIVLDKKV